MTLAATPTRQTIREQIMVNLKAIFEADTDVNRVSWDVVSRKPLSKNSIADNGYALGIYDVTEKIKEGTGFEYHYLNVVFEFHAQISEDDEPSSYLNHCLGSIVDLIRENQTIGGLVLDVTEKGSELDIDGSFDRYCSGIIIFDVSYRCRSNDPYTRA